MTHRPGRSGPRRRRAAGVRRPATAAPPSRSPEALRLSFIAWTKGEALLHLEARNPTTAGPGVLTILVDGRLASHAVVPSSASIPIAVALGTVEAGRHVVVVRGIDGYARSRIVGPPMIVLADAADPGGIALRHSPILYGRILPSRGGPFQNAHTDVPLLAWHTAEWRAAHRVLEFTVLWSHEDGGTDGPTLMARWGRTTDIEWVYRVAVDAAGHRVPGTAVYQGPGHATHSFAGRYEGDHPVLQVCTDNNMVSDRVTGSMRFALAADESLPAGRAREVAMELHPWTFEVSADEVEADGLVEAGRDPWSPALGNPLDYLHLEVRTRRDPPGGVRSGLALGVRLRGDPAVYRTDHRDPDRAIVRDGPVATAVRLPAGTRIGDVAALLAFRVPIAGSRDRITVDGLARGFFLDCTLRPGPSLVGRARPALLSAARPWALVWESAAPSGGDGAARCPGVALRGGRGQR